MYISRNEFAEETAQAYVDQFGIDRSPVMNNMVITYDSNGDFGHGSSLSVADNKIVVLVLEDGMFGSEVEDTDNEMHESIYAYLTDEGNNGSDELWSEVLSSIAEWDSETE